MCLHACTCVGRELQGETDRERQREREREVVVWIYYVVCIRFVNTKSRYKLNGCVCSIVRGRIKGAPACV